jgi:hypothetical protein
VFLLPGDRDVAVPARAGRGGLTRRQALLGAGGAAASVIVGGVVTEALRAGGGLQAIESFVSDPLCRVGGFCSRPGLRPPTVAVTSTVGGSSGGADPGFLLLGPGPVSLKGSEQYGPMIVDRSGGLVWFRPLAPGLEVTNFTTAEYQGEPVLVWWEGKVLPSGYGRGEAVLVDRSYREVARVRAAAGRSMDLHALSLTRAGTALFTCYPQIVPADLSSIGGSRDAHVYESIIQEVDIATGRLVFEWRSLQHIAPDASHEPLGEPYDYLHPNSIQQLPDGNLLVSARHTWALYKLERGTGKMIWTLGGKRTQFGIGAGAEFAWQHDAQLRTDQVLTVFDNGSAGPLQTERQSRGLVLRVDEARRTVELRNAYTSPEQLVAGAMGSVQALPSGNVLVGWGTTSHTSEFAPDGTLRVDYALPDGMYSYRGLWHPWAGVPDQHPALAGTHERQTGRTLLYASWNGATAVTGWLVHTGSSRDSLRPLGIAMSRGFETAISLPSHVRFAAVTPLSRHREQLRRSDVLAL